MKEEKELSRSYIFFSVEELDTREGPGIFSSLLQVVDVLGSLLKSIVHNKKWSCYVFLFDWSKSRQHNRSHRFLLTYYTHRTKPVKEKLKHPKCQTTNSSDSFFLFVGQRYTVS